MSGRLIILPKKSYCPWNPANVERVLRDERIEKERLEREKDQQHKEQAQERLDAIKNRKGGSSVTKSDDVTGKHVNLFEAEERAMVEKALTGDETSTKQTRNKGIMPVVLGETELKSRGENRPFYLRSREHVTGDGSSTDKDDKRKARMDPMERFVRNEHAEAKQTSTFDSPSRKRTRRKHYDEDSNDSDSDSSTSSRHHKGRRDKSRRRRHKRSRKEERRKRRKRGSHESSCVSIEELRRRRAEREQHESQREAALLHRNSHRSTHHYQDQYNPGLSRN